MFIITESGFEMQNASSLLTLPVLLEFNFTLINKERVYKMKNSLRSVLIVLVAVIGIILLQVNLIYAEKDYLTIGSNLINKEFARPALLKSFGTPEVKSKWTVSPVDGFKHQNLEFKTKGIFVNLLLNDKNKQEISAITITKPGTFKTLRNIDIGSPKSDVLKAYKNEINPEETNDNSLIAGSLYGGIIFEIAKGKVTKIFMGASAE